jgi:hypothetical protein
MTANLQVIQQRINNLSLKLSKTATELRKDIGDINGRFFLASNLNTK